MRHIQQQERLYCLGKTCVCPFAVTYVPLFAGTSLYISRTTTLNQALMTQALRQDALRARRVRVKKIVNQEKQRAVTGDKEEIISWFQR